MSFQIDAAREWCQLCSHIIKQLKNDTMRYNIFNQIHKALRALLCDTLVTIQQTNFENPAEVAVALEKISQVLAIFENHAWHEDHGILPVIEQYDPALVASFETEHVKDHELGENLSALVRSVETETEVIARIQKGQQLLYAFVAFVSFNFDHMNREESQLNQQLWRYLSDEEILRINHSIVSSIPPEESQFASFWMIKAMNNGEITRWLKEVQKNAPAPVFQMLYTIAEKELPDLRFRTIAEELTEGALVA